MLLNASYYQHFDTSHDMSAKQSLGNQTLEKELLAGHRGLRPHHQMYVPKKWFTLGYCKVLEFSNRRLI